MHHKKIGARQSPAFRDIDTFVILFKFGFLPLSLLFCRVGEERTRIENFHYWQWNAMVT
jgi:hypothetical protein